MAVGVVRWFDCKKGYGFVADSNGVDVFVHHSVIEGEGFRRLWDGETVEFESTSGPRGILATRVRRVAVEEAVESRDRAAQTRLAP